MTSVLKILKFNAVSKERLTETCSTFFKVLQVTVIEHSNTLMQCSVDTLSEFVGIKTSFH